MVGRSIESHSVGGALVIVETETIDGGDIESIEWTTMAANFLHEVSEDDILDEEIA